LHEGEPDTDVAGAGGGGGGGMGGVIVCITTSSSIGTTQVNGGSAGSKGAGS